MFECPRCGYRTLSWRDEPFCNCRDDNADKQKEAFAKLWPHLVKAERELEWGYVKDEEEKK